MLLTLSRLSDGQHAVSKKVLCVAEDGENPIPALSDVIKLLLLNVDLLLSPPTVRLDIGRQNRVSCHSRDYEGGMSSAVGAVCTNFATSGRKGL